MGRRGHGIPDKGAPPVIDRRREMATPHSRVTRPLLTSGTTRKRERDETARGHRTPSTVTSPAGMRPAGHRPADPPPAQEGTPLMEFVLIMAGGIALIYLVTYLMIGCPWPNRRADRATLTRLTRKNRS